MPLLCALGLLTVGGLGGALAARDSGAQLPGRVIHASLTDDFVRAFDFAPNTEVTFQIDASEGGASLFGPVTHTTDGSGSYFLQRNEHGVDLDAGKHVTIVEGPIAKGLTLVPITITSVDAATNVISGTAPVGPVDVYVTPDGGECCVGNGITTISDGAWSADFDTVGTDVLEGHGGKAHVNDVDADTTVYDTPHPHVHASLTGDWVNLHDFRAGSTVDVTIGGVNRTVITNGGGFASIQRSDHGVDLAPGTLISATGNAVTKTNTLTTLTFDALNAATDVASGTALAGKTVRVAIHDNTGGVIAERETVADAGGNWTADFSGIFDVQPGMFADAHVADAEHDNTVAEFRNPILGAGIDGDWISLNNWNPGSSIALNIGGAASNATVDGNGNAFVQRSTHGQDVTIGMTITATDGTRSKELVVANVRVNSVDPATDVVAGTAVAGAQVHVHINRPPPNQPPGNLTTTADPSGNWSVDFTGTVDVVQGDGAGATVGDADGDNTTADLFPRNPTVGAGVDADWIFLNQWVPGSTVTLNIGGVNRNVTVDGNGFANVQRSVHGQDIVPGMTITAGDGTTLKTLVVADIRITNVDTDADTVTGIAPPNTNVHVNVHQGGPGPPLGQRNTTSDGAGNWSVSFAGSVDLRYANMGISASVGDNDGDFTNADKFLPMPMVGAGIEGDFISLNNWQAGSTVELNIGGVTRNATVNDNGSAFIQRSTHGQDITIGMTITADDGTTLKTLVVADVRITSIDPATDVVAGTAPPNAAVNVNMHSSSTFLGGLSTTADGSGNWSVDFTGTVDVQFGMNAGAHVPDADGDITTADKVAVQPPLPRPPGALVIGHAPPDSLDPHVSFTTDGWAVIDQMFRGLTRYDRRTGEFPLDLAKSYEVSADLLTWTFTLDAATWSDGKTMTPEDVVLGIQRAKDPATGGEPAAGVRALLDPIQSVEVGTASKGKKDKNGTVVFHLSRPIAYLPALLSVPGARPVPMHAIQQHGASWLDPGKIVVSGAYTLTSRSPVAIVLGVNANYNLKKPSIQTVVYDTSDRSQFPARYVAGELDFVPANLLGLPTNADVKADARFAADFVVGPSVGTQYLLFNAGHGPTTNRDVRRALSAATDRARLAELGGDPSLQARTFTPPRVPGAVPFSAGIGIVFDEVAALTYRAAAGAAFPGSITIRYFPPQNATRRRAAEILKADWERIFGPTFTVDVEAVSAAQMQSQWDNPDPSAQASVSMTGWNADYPDANNFLVDALRNGPPRWSNAAFDALVARAATTLDPRARNADYADAERILNETEAAIAPMYTIPDAFVRKPTVTVVGDRIERWSLAR